MRERLKVIGNRVQFDYEVQQDDHDPDGLVATDPAVGWKAGVVSRAEVRAKVAIAVRAWVFDTYLHNDAAGAYRIKLSERALVWLSLKAVGLRRSEVAVLTWADVQRWEDGSGRITVIRSKRDAEAQGAVVRITPAAMRPAGADSEARVFGLSESQIARRVKANARAAGNRAAAWSAATPAARRLRQRSGIFRHHPAPTAVP